MTSALELIRCDGSAYNEWSLLRSLLLNTELRRGAKDLIEGRPRSVNAVKVIAMCERTGSFALKDTLMSRLMG